MCFLKTFKYFFVSELNILIKTNEIKKNMYTVYVSLKLPEK